MKDTSAGRQPAPHPLLPNLQNMLRNSQADPAWLIRMIDARETDMDPQSRPYASLRDLEAYADETQGALLMFLLDSVVLPQSSEQAEACMTYAGRAIGLTTLLRGFVFHASRGDCYLPLDILSKHELTVSEAMKAGATKAQGHHGAGMNSAKSLSSVIFDVASLANAYAEDSAKLWSSLPSAAKPAILPLVASQIWLESLQKHNFDMNKAQLHSTIPRIQLHWRLLQTSFATA